MKHLEWCSNITRDLSACIEKLVKDHHSKYQYLLSRIQHNEVQMGEVVEKSDKVMNLSSDTDVKVKEMRKQLEDADKDFSDKLNTFKSVVNKNKTRIYKEIYQGRNMTLSLKTSMDEFLKTLFEENTKHLIDVNDRIVYIDDKVKAIHEEMFGKKETVVKKKVKVKTEGQKIKIKKLEDQLKNLKAETRKSFCKLDKSLKLRAKSVDYS